MDQFLKLYFLAVPVFFVIDMIWLGLIASGFYKAQLGELLTKNINWIAAISFYLIFIFGIIFFVVVPTLGKNSIMVTVLYGAIFGFIAYATYDLTNLATLKNWPLTLALVDMFWGATLSASVSVVVVIVSKWLHIA